MANPKELAEAWEAAWDRTGLTLSDGPMAAFRAGYAAGYRDADTARLRAAGVAADEIPLTVHELAPPWADAKPGATTLMTGGDEVMGVPVKARPCACGTVEAWHNPGCLLYPEGGYPADQPWRGPPCKCGADREIARGSRGIQHAINCPQSGRR